MTRSELLGWLEFHAFRLVSQPTPDDARAMLADSTAAGIKFTRRTDTGRGGVWMVASFGNRRARAFRRLTREQCERLDGLVPVAESAVLVRATVIQNTSSRRCCR